MAVILPFNGYFYNPQKVSLSSVFAPPYDVVSDKEKDSYINGDGFNILSLEMPKSLDAVKGQLNKWIRDEVILKDKSESVYPYEIEYKVADRSYKRRGLICLVRVEPWESRVILPHEKTFSTVTSQRFNLLKSVGAQFSQIFLISEGKGIISHFIQSSDAYNLYEVKDYDGNIHRLSIISSRDQIATLKDLFSDIRLFIADGHHRYTTVLNFKEYADKNGLFKGISPCPHHYFMAYIVDINDDGLLSLPTHRVIKHANISMDEAVKRLNGCFSILKAGEFGGDFGALERLLTETDRKGCFIMVFLREGRFLLLKSNNNGKERLISDGVSGPLLELEVISADQLALPLLFKKCADKLKEENMLYYEPFCDTTRIGGDSIILFLPPTPVSSLVRVSEAGLTMPHKATYFYPKILTGSIIRIMDGH